MKVLLINPPITHMVKFGISSFMDNMLADNPMPPLGLMYLASYIEKEGHEVKIWDMMVSDKDFNDYNDADIVGITATTLTLYDAVQVAKQLKSIWDIPIVIGGAHCGIYPEETKGLGCFDYVVQGEGEIPLLNILNSNYINNVNVIKDLDSIPFPARHLIDNNKYHSVRDKSNLVTTMVTSRGCPYNCSFCYQPHYDRKWRARSAENVIAEMQEIVKLGIHEVEIYDDTFTYDKNRVYEICYSMLNKGIKLDWAIRTRVDKVDKDILQLMALAGCKRINYGIESINRETLKTLRKGFNVDLIPDVIQWTKDANIEIQAYLMIGSPDETKKQILETISFANKYIPDYAYYSITTPTPGTSLYSKGLSEGKYDDYWKDFACNPVPDFPIKFWQEENRKELVELYNYGYKSFYSRPSYILRQLGKTKSLNELARKAKIAAGLLK